MQEIITLLKPRLWSYKNGEISRDSESRTIRWLLFGAIGLLFWIGIFIVFFRVLNYFQAVDSFGDILAHKLLSMVLITFFTLLIFSSIITSLSKLYLSRDLILVHALPVPAFKIFQARWLESTVDSSWMVVVYSLPVFLSYGIVFQAGPFYYLTLVLTIPPMCVIASCLSAAVVVLVAVILPAGRIRTVFVFLSLILFVILLLAFRLMRPEQLANPDSFSSVLQYFRSLETGGSPWLPTTWIFDGIRSALSGSYRSALFHLSLSWSFAMTLVFVMSWIASAAYFSGFSKAQTTAERLLPGRSERSRGAAWLLHFLSGPARAFAVKEIKVFFRDQTQWPQIFLIVALIVIYLYNFSVLPLEKSPINTIYLQNILSFLNMGLASFVLTALAARFVFPAVSTEGAAWWIVRAAPVNVRTFLLVKFFVYYVPMLLLSEVLIVATNILLQVTDFMMVLSVVTVFCMVPGLVAMGVGLGAAYPDFQSENPAQAVTSFGGLLFMILCTLFIGLVIVLEAGPVYQVFMAGMHGRSMTTGQWIWLVASFSLALLLCALAVVLPMHIGARRLEKQS
jgi:ABC-2 type transport system permease protein